MKIVLIPNPRMHIVNNNYMHSNTGRQSLYSKVVNRLSTIWLEFVTGFLWWGIGYVPFHHIRRLFYRFFGMTIGKGSTIHMMARIYDPRFITIGKDTIVGERVLLDGRRQMVGSTGGISIGDHVDIASEVMIWTAEHDLKSERWLAKEEPVAIEDYVFIGPRAIILPGITVARGAVVAAGAVVTKNVAELDIVAGVPAKPIAKRPISQLDYTLGRTRWFQ